MKLPIYLDNHATTPLDPRVLEVMLPYFTDIFGNAASIDHEHGFQAKKAVDNAREQIAEIINATEDEIVFTSGATESDNLALLGVAEAYKEKGNHIITCITEHKAILDTCKYLEQKGWMVTYLPVDSQGMISLDELKSSITPQTVLVSMMFANNEIGVVAPIEEIGHIAHEHGVLFHTDATQAAGYIPIDVKKMGIDLLSLSGHKIYGPKGIGGLFVRRHSPRVKIKEQIHGGGHEGGMRSGTLNVTGIIGFSRALEICKADLYSEGKRLKELRDRLLFGLKSNLKNIEINGHSTKRLPNNLSIAIPGIESRSLLVKLKHDISISIGSACTTALVEPSHVIMALGFGEARAHSSIRIGLGRFTSDEEIDYAIIKIVKAVNDLASMSER